MINVPNALTIFRILMVPSYLVVLYSGFGYANQVAAALFTIAASTDALDGYIARRYKLVTDLGKILDPVADKIMVMAAMVAMVELGRLDGWILILMLFRDFLVDALRGLVASRGTIIAAGIWGKVKTVLQMVAVGFLILQDTFFFFPFPSHFVGTVLIYVALAASIYSGFVYFRQYAKHLKSDK